jgi:hypothetical protein
MHPGSDSEKQRKDCSNSKNALNDACIPNKSFKLVYVQETVCEDVVLVR